MIRDESYLGRLRRAQIAFANIKSAQKLGPDGWIVYRNEGARDNYDIDTGVGFNNLVRWLITYIPDVEGDVIGAMDYTIELDGIAAFGIMQKYGTKNQWIFMFRTDFSGCTNCLLKVKFIVGSTHEGTLTVQQL